MQTKVAGQIKIRLLPTPELSLREVTLSDGAGSAVFAACDAVHVALSLGALMSGAVRLTHATFYSPKIMVARRADGALALPTALGARSIGVGGVDELVIHDGQATIAGRADAPSQGFTHLELTASALSLDAFKGEGALMSGATPVKFHFVAIAEANNSAHLKLAAQAPSLAISGEFDGEIKANSSTPGAISPSFTGNAALAGLLVPNGLSHAVPWRISGPLRLDENAAAVVGAEISLGREGRELKANGSGAITLGRGGAVEANLKAKQLDLDAMLRTDGDTTAAPDHALALASAALLDNVFFGLDRPLKLSLATPLIILGGDSLEQVEIALDRRANAPANGEVAFDAPGQTHWSAAGVIGQGDIAGWKGLASVKSQDLGRFLDWLTGGDPTAQQRVASARSLLPVGAVEASAEFALNAYDVAAHNFILKIPRGEFTGEGDFTFANHSSVARLEAQLATDRLDIGALPLMAETQVALADLDLSLGLRAKSIHIAQFGNGEFESGSLVANLTKQGASLKLDPFEIENLGGATLKMKGALDAGAASLSGNLTAHKLDAFAALLRNAAPGGLSEFLAARAGELSPASLDWSVHSRVDALNAGQTPDTFKVEGALGRTSLSMKIGRSDPAANEIAAELSAETIDAAQLLRQIGVPALGDDPRHATINAKAHGRWPGALQGEANAALAGSDVNWRGTWKPGDDGGAAQMIGVASMKSKDISPLLAMAGQVNFLSSLLSADLTSEVMFEDGMLRLSQLRGALGGVNLSGDLALRGAAPGEVVPEVAAARAIAGEAPGADEIGISGALSLDRLSLGALALLAPGWPKSSNADATASPIKFDSAASSLPPLTLHLRVGAVPMFEGNEAREVQIQLRRRPGQLDIDDFSLQIAGGALSGSAALRRAGPNVALQGALEAKGVRIATPLASATISGTMNYDGAGRDLREISASLIGTGAARINEFSIPRLDPDALSRVIDAMQTPDAGIDPTRVAYALEKELDKHALAMPATQTALTLGGGALKFGPLQTSNGAQSLSLSGEYDLSGLSPSLRASFMDARPLKYWSAGAPSFEALLSVAGGKISRRLEASSLAAGLATQSIARQTDQIAAMDADIRERAAFNRRLKAGRFFIRRQRENDAYRADQAQSANEMQRRRSALESRRANEAARQAVASDIGEAPTPSPVLKPLFRQRIMPIPIPDPTTNGLY